MKKRLCFVLSAMLVFLMAACGQTEVVPTTTVPSTAFAETVCESTSAVEETVAPEVHTGELKTVYIANEEAYREYIANNEMPDDFIRYDALSCFGKFHSFTAPFGWEYWELNEYRYEFVDENGYRLGLKIERGEKIRGAGKEEVSAPENGDMRKPARENCAVILGELRYVYNSGYLLSISWFDGEMTYVISGGSTLSDYPENEDTVLGKLLNSNTAEAAWKEITAGEMLSVSEKIKTERDEKSAYIKKEAMENLDVLSGGKSQIVYSYEEDFAGFNMFSRNGTIDFGSSFTLRPLAFLNEIHPVTNWTKVSDNLGYTTYLLENNDVQCTAYLFFSGQDVERDETLQSWELDGRVFFMSKVLQYADFSGIAPGSEIYDVIEVDPVTEFQWYKDDKPEYRRSTSEGEDRMVANRYYYEFITYHYLTDGILKITYGRENVGDTPAVKDMTFTEGHKMDAFIAGTAEFVIDPKDYPKA